SCTTASINSSGATVLIAVVGDYVGGSTTLTDSKSNTWTPLTTRGSGSLNETFYYSINPTVGSSHTFTANSSSSYPCLAVAAFTNVKTTSPLDQSNGANGNGNSPSIGSITP